MTHRRPTRLFALLLALAAFLLAASLGEAAMPGKEKLADKRGRLAEACLAQVQFSAKAPPPESAWRTCSRLFGLAYRTDPYHSKAAAHLFALGDLSARLHEMHGKKGDLVDALAAYDDVVTLFPASDLADDALLHSAALQAKRANDPQAASRLLARLIAVYPGGDKLAEAEATLKTIKNTHVPRPPAADKAPTAPQPSPPVTQAVLSATQPPSVAGPARVSKVQHWSTKSYTRVVIETDRPVAYEGTLLKQEGSQPRRLYVNLTNTRIPRDLAKSIPVHDGLLKQVRSAQHTADSVRVVLDTHTLSEYKIFSLPDPARIVVDVVGAAGEPQGEGARGKKAARPPSVASASPSLAQQLGLGIRKVVIDPGHGGKDPGAIGAFGLQEKDIVLKIAKKLARVLANEQGLEVLLTRKHDTFVPLEERTAIANTSEGDLFVSIHANAARSGQARGVETYYLDLAASEDAMQVAALENAASAKTISDLQSLLTDLIQNSKRKESSRLAGLVHESLVTGIGKKFKGIDDHGVKKAPFIVLIGARMPAILSEVAFISNEEEARRLQSEEYLDLLAAQLAAGIVQYSRSLGLAKL